MKIILLVVIVFSLSACGSKVEEISAEQKAKNILPSENFMEKEMKIPSLVEASKKTQPPQKNTP